MRVNTKLESIKTYEGAPAKRIKPIDELRRTVIACSSHLNKRNRMVSIV